MEENISSNQAVAVRTRFEEFKEKGEERFYRALNYLTIYLFIIVVYGGALVTDYLLFALMEWLLKVNVERYPVVALGFDYARIGLAALFIIAAVFHGIISTINQMKLDIQLSREGG